MKIFYTSAIMFAITVVTAFFIPNNLDNKNVCIVPVLVLLTAAVTLFGVWQLRQRRKREEELFKMILTEEKRTIGRFLVHEWRGLIHTIGIQAELMERAENIEGTRVNCSVIRKILDDETAKSDNVEVYFKKNGNNTKKASRAIKRAVSDLRLIHKNITIKLTYNTPKKDMKADLDKLYPCVSFALMNAILSFQNKKGLIELTVADRAFGFTEFLEISVSGGGLLFDQDNDDLFNPFNESSDKYRNYFGLASARRLATDMGGFIETEINGENSTIYIVVPVTK